MGVRFGLSRLVNSVRLRKLFGPRRQEVTGDRRKLHSEELYELSSPYVIKFEVGGECSTFGEKVNAYRFLVEKV